MDDFDQVVLEFMNDYSTQVIYLKSTQGEYDPAIGEAPVTTTEIPITAIQLDLPLRSNGSSTQNGTLIQDGDKQLFIRPPQKVDENSLPLEINVSADRIKIGTYIWSIITYKEIVVNGDDQLLIELYIRR